MWSHTEFIFEGYEIEDMQEVVTYTPPAGTVVSYTASVSGVPQSLFTVEGGGSIVASSVGSNLVGMYPMLDMSYIPFPGADDITVTDWDDIPTGKFMTEMRSDPKQEYEWMVTCVCNWLTASVPPVPQVATIVLPIRIWHQYDSDQALLKEKISEQVL